MIFEKLNSNHIEDAANLAFEAYINEKNKVSALPDVKDSSEVCEIISKLSKNDLGIVALEGTNLMGFMGCYGPLENYFGTSNGVFCPVEGHGALQENKTKIYTKLYQKASDLWVSQGLLSHTIAIYTRDAIAVDSFFHSGFGLRCVDAIRPLQKIDIPINSEYQIRPAVKADYAQIAEHENSLTKHLRSAPMFMPRNPNKTAEYIAKSEEEGVEYFVAVLNGRIIGFIEIADEGENFASNNNSVKNVCGAYVVPEYRSQKIADMLLSYVSDILLERGYLSLGVDYESFNPTANAFWQKHFTPYTYSLARRIDERIYPIKKL